ncbi:MAG: hypothetical protein FD123_2150 [Bacteroidetes bacterium]|nr:MAG: hypothetical protein FD123_2150 [Bacteroidota bacterium]
MEKHEGFWYSVGDFFWSCFEALEWTYNTMSVNKVLIGVAFVCFAWWMTWQYRFNKEASLNKTLK